MTTRGRVDCYINPVDSSMGRRNQEIFGNITGFLSGQVLTDLGITLVSYNTGSGTGHGLSFWDTGTSSANNFTWAVYRFNNAPRGKFDMLFLLASGSGQAVSPFNVSLNANGVQVDNNSIAVVGWAAAVHPTGSVTNPWNGPVNAQGSGTLGSPIWTTSSAGKQPNVFPRANSTDGSFGTTRNYLAELHDDDQFAIPMRMHLVATEGSFTCVQDYGLANAYRIFHFGSYNPRPATTPVTEAPYFMFTGPVSPGSVDSLQLYTSLYGAAAGTSFNVGQDGGIAIPTQASGSKDLALITVGTPDNNIGAFNTFINSGSYDLLPLYVGVSDSTFKGILGTADNVGVGFGMVAGVVNAVSGTCAIGRNVGGSLKLLIPWSGSSPGSLSNVRTGRSF